MTVRAEAEPYASGRRSGPSKTRLDIQALRALAVALVVVFHLWPSALSGGYVGVDVFFVISGFLITTHLLDVPPRGMGDVVTFWSRRIRRLLPASFLVLALTLIASRLVAPDTQWAETARSVKYATLYVLNWHLADNAVDYLNADDAPSPVQHFWSLSIEEQFYFFWPIVIGLLFLGAARWRISAKVSVLIGIAAVVAASLTFSIAFTAESPSPAYFFTPTRVWELGAGGLLAAGLSMRSGPAVRTRLSFPAAGVGVLLILLSSVTYGADTDFPGWTALVPVIGCLLVIWAEPDGWSRCGALYKTRPVQWLGDVSYGVYLWHWPLLVLVPNLSGGEAGWLDRVAVGIATLVLAGATKSFVEDRFRSARRPPRTVFASTAAGMSLLVGLAALQVAEVDRISSETQDLISDAKRSAGECFGASALVLPECDYRNTDQLVPPPAVAGKDKSEAYADVSGGEDCWSYVPSFPTVKCTFGNPDGAVSVALVGNSHAGHWLPALQQIAERRNWRITTFLASRCALAATRQDVGSARDAAACGDWVRRTTREVAAQSPDLVLVSNRISVPVVGRSLEESRVDYATGYGDVLESWNAAGLEVVILRDTPAFGDVGLHSVPDCLAVESPDVSKCARPRESVVPYDPIVEAARRLKRPVPVLDMNDYLCEERRCEAAVGGVVVYFDGSHMTATYARTLAPYLEKELEAAVPRFRERF